MHKVGMYGGSFNPLHLGHINDIIIASPMCEKLYIVLSCSKNSDEINYKERFNWLKQSTKELSNIQIITIFDNSINKDSYDWIKGKEDILKQIGSPIDIVFCGDDYKNNQIFAKLYPDSYIHYFDRNLIKISSTEIRENPLKNFDYLPKVVQPYYVKKVAVVGTESCGKSILVKNLATYFETNYVEEVGRDICEEAGGIDNMQPKDFEAILLKHRTLELERIKESNRLLFLDTEAIVTLYYFKLLYNKDNKQTKLIKELGASINAINNIDLYIYLEPDVKWVQDGTRTYGEETIRNKNNKLLKTMLKDYNINYVSVSGDYEERYEKAKTLVKKLIK